MPSKLDPHIAVIEGWRRAAGVNCAAIVGRLSEKYPEEFGAKQHSIVQHLLMTLRRKAAKQLVAQEPLGDAEPLAHYPGLWTARAM